MSRELRLHLSEEGADAERLAVLAGYLRPELLQLDIEDVTALQAGECPPGFPVVGVAIVGALMIALGQSAEDLRLVVIAIRDWLRRGEGPAAWCGWNSTVRRWSCRGRARLTRVWLPCVS
jgi:hypothetical protein